MSIPDTRHHPLSLVIQQHELSQSYSKMPSDRVPFTVSSFNDFPPLQSERARRASREPDVHTSINGIVNPNDLTTTPAYHIDSYYANTGTPTPLPQPPSAPPHSCQANSFALINAMNTVAMLQAWSVDLSNRAVTLENSVASLYVKRSRRAQTPSGLTHGVGFSLSKAAPRLRRPRRQICKPTVSDGWFWITLINLCRSHRFASRMTAAENSLSSM